MGSRQGWTPISIAEQQGHTALVAVLRKAHRLQGGADDDVSDGEVLYISIVYSVCMCL